jgi:hypothetical protein
MQAKASPSLDRGLGLFLFGLAWNTLLLLYAVLMLSTLCGLAMVFLRSRSQPDQYPQVIATLLSLARDTEVAEVHSKLAEALKTISQLKDPIFRQLASERLDSLVQQVQALSEATIEYTSTESWRVAYEELLRSPGLHLYRSVSHIESVHYWQDGPGTQSTQLNLELQDSRVIGVERIAIIADHLWPESSLFPIEPIHNWLEEQHRHGIYGSRAIGIQVADPAGRTMRFVLSFDFDKVERAESVWDRLLVYAISYKSLLDQQH